MKKLFRTVLVTVMALSMLVSTISVSADEQVIEQELENVTSESSIDLSSEYTPLSASDTMPKSGKYILTEDYTLSSQCLLTGSLDLDLAGHTIFINDTSGKVVYGYFRTNTGSYKLNITSSQEGGTIEYTAGSGSLFFTPGASTSYPNIGTVTNNIYCNKGHAQY